MENIDLSFIQRFRSLVFVSGKHDIANSLLDILKKISKENDWSNFNFKAVDPLAVPVRKNKIYNSKGSREGIFRSNWLKKRLEIIPSTVIFAYDLRDVPLGKEGAVFSDYNKHKDGLRARHITSVFMFLISKPQQAAYEKQLEFFRKALETDSKFIFFLPQSFENNVPSIRKLEKILPEASKNHYNELLKKHKRRVNKSYELIQAHEFNTRMFIKMAILYELLLKPDKSQAQYEQAYNTISTVLLQYHQSRINQASRSIPGVYLPANFDSIHWLEELRYLADVIRIRLFYLAVQKNDINEAHRLLYSHINFYKDKLDYVDPRFKFEEFKWKMRVYYYVCNVLLNSYEINPKFCFFDANYISSRVFAFADFAIKRREAFLHNNPDPNPPANIAVDINYLGFDRYGEMPRTTDVAYLNEILKSRIAAENKLNVYEDPIDLLQRLLKCMKPKDGAAFLTEYSLAQLYYLNGHRDRFLEMVPQIIALIGKKSWNDLIKNILAKNEQFLSHNKDWESLMVNCFNFFILNQSNPERIKLAQESISKLGKSNNYKFDVREQTLFNIEVAFEPPVIKYLHDFTGKITLTIPEFLREYIDEIELIFNDAKYYIKENVTTFKKEGKHDIFTFTTSATHLVQTNRLNIVEINLRGRQQTSNGSEVGLLFTIKEPAFLSNQNNILLLQLVDDLQVKIESSQPGYTNEKVDVRLRLFKKDQETKIKHVSVFLYVYERGRVHDIVPGFFPRDIAMYHVDDRRELVEMSKDSNLTMLEFDNESQEMILNFVVRATVEGAVTYVFKVKYDVIKMENDKMIEIPKEITEHFTSRTLSPFVTFLNWKTNLKEINHLRDMKTMIHRQPLPLNNTCCLNITFSPIYHDIIVQHVKVNLNRSSQVMILKEPSVPSNQLLLKNQVFTTHLMLRPIEETEELAVGDLELHITRKENQEKAEKEPIIFNVSLQLISVHKRAFTVFIEADTSCEVGKLVPYKVTIINNTFHLHKLDFQVLPNEAFYFSGRSRYIIDILPKSTKEIKLHMVPVEIGKHKAPTCIVKCLTMEGETLLDTDETRIIYVFPQKHFTEELDLV